MRVVVCSKLGSPESLSVEEREAPPAGPDQVAIDIRSAGLNFVDALMVQGLYQVRPDPPFVPGSEVAGTVAALGEGVEGLAVGDRVWAATGMGGFAERVAVSAERVRPIPEGLSFGQGATFMQSYCTALLALKLRGRLREGETLLVLGASGGVGLAAIDVGRALGARVIAAASSPEKLELCRARGADACIDYAREDLKARAKELAPGGLDMVCDPVGGDYAEPALRALGPDGRFLVLGFAAGGIPRVPFNLILLKSCQVVGVNWGGTQMRDPGLNPRLLDELDQLMAAGRIDPVEPNAYPLERAGEALADMLGRRLVGKAALVP